jgi:glycosyltransferase involved in cell wall biosynthesis
MSAILFSIIIPTYNAEKYIEETIESALRQTETNTEIIVVDDGSKDNTVNVVKKIGHSKITIISQPNSGVSVARNYGAKYSSGEILAFLDADDIWMSEKLMVQKDKLIKGYNIVYTNRINFGDIGDLPHIQTEIEDMPEGDIFEKLLLGNMITNSSVVIRKNNFMALNGFNIDLLTCEDWDLWLRCSMQDRIGFCSEPLVKYRLHSAGKSRNYKRQGAARERILSSILDTERGKQISENRKNKAWANIYCSTAWAAARSKDIAHALKCYGKALRLCPFDTAIWYDVARALAGRI